MMAGQRLGRIGLSSSIRITTMALFRLMCLRILGGEAHGGSSLSFEWSEV